ncbi:MAG: endonuclease [Muribaculaceae bacterium]|nr:endonuclease [Muribaculaceae bacterium]
MKKTRILMMLAMALLAGTLSLRAEIPEDYYAEIYGKSGQALKNAISALCKRHTVVTYGSLWYHFPHTDCRFEDPNLVWDMYSNRTYKFRGSSAVSGMNREHSLPKSWWGGDYSIIYGTSSQNSDAYTDLNHLYPSDGEANMAKSNYPLGEVSKASFNNGSCLVGTPVTGQGGGAATVFEPNDEYKGDFARTYFYMATTYQDYTWKYKYMLNNSSWLTLNQWSINLLLKWARQDPVSDKELARNEAVYKIQNNRNPFIDNPDLMEYIWGDKANEVFNDPDPDPDDPDKTPRLITPSPGTSIEFGEVALGRTLTAKVYIKAKHLTQDLSVTVYKDDSKSFKVSVTTVPRSSAMTAEGYPLEISYSPKMIGNHTCRLLISDGGLTGSFAAEINASCLPAPALMPVVALDAVVEGNNYTARWEPANVNVDFYMVTRTVYGPDNGIISSDEFNTEETTYTFNDLEAGQTHTYFVQSSRLGYLSPTSNVITVNATNGIDDITSDKPVAFLAMEGAVVVKCSEPLKDVRIYNINGQLVKVLGTVENDDIIALPGGIYIFVTSSNSHPSKLIIK